MQFTHNGYYRGSIPLNLIIYSFWQILCYCSSLDYCYATLTHTHTPKVSSCVAPKGGDGATHLPLTSLSDTSQRQVSVAVATDDRSRVASDRSRAASELTQVC